MSEAVPVTRAIEVPRGRGFAHESDGDGDDEYYTPPHIFEALGLVFDLDPCHPMGPRLPWVPARNVYTKADNGLAKPWFGRPFVNPPYGIWTPHWMGKLSEHGRGVALVFNRTDTTWYHLVAPTMAAKCEIRGRLSFVGRDGKPRLGKNGKKGTAGAGSMLLAWGEEEAQALSDSKLGIVVVPR